MPVTSGLPGDVKIKKDVKQELHSNTFPGRSLGTSPILNF
jgi:hypothetical protein